MKQRVPYFATSLLFCLLTSVPVMHAQQVNPVPSGSPTTTPPTTPAPPAIPPDQKAYDEARRIKDPQKKIEALEKVNKDYPDRFVAYQSRNDVLDVLIKSFPDQKERIRAAAEKILDPNQIIVIGGGGPYLTVASKLMDAGLFLDWAEELTKKGSAQYEDDTAKALRRQRARYQDTLGRIYLKQGKTKEAKKSLRLALINEPGLPTALIGLAQIAEKSGDHKAALEYLALAAVKSPLKKSDRQQMESAYRATHHDSLTGLEEMLDEKYRKLNAGLRFDHYQATAKRSNRTALAELFTGSGCGPCVAADLGFDGLLERYNRQELVVLVYHLHIPLPDPMTNAATVERGKYYGVPGTPTPVVDGLRLPSSGGSREMTKGFYDRINPKVEAELESPANADIKLTATADGDGIKANVTVDKVTAASPDLKLQIALTENELRYTGENGMRFHPMVVRSLAGKDSLGFALAAAGPTNVEWTFDLKAMTDQLRKYLDSYEQQGHRGDTFTFSEKKFQIDRGNLSLVAFVQDMKTKQVLQTVYLKLNPATTASVQTAAR
ncbi:MAG TPA: tetratricopeptide repeat protein [Pyrinomonadaceae bacterium]|nr:tetratricopeptide repeat protein [Pyrinomonadaceae bacterium]